MDDDISYSFEYGSDTQVYVSGLRNASAISITIPRTVVYEYSDWGDCDDDGNLKIKCRTCTVMRIRDQAFYHRTSLRSVTIQSGLTSIGGTAFCGCSGLTSVTIPSSVTNIGPSAFYNCGRLTSVTIGDSVTRIWSSAFSVCSELTSVHISDMASWCGILFDDDTANPLYYAHNLYLNGEKVENLVVPDGVTSIGNRAFKLCSGLTSVRIPDSVTNIGNQAFSHCSGIMSFAVGSGNANYKAVNGLLLSKDGKTLIAGVNGDVTIPDSVTNIGNQAFRGYSRLTSVTISDSVTSIGDSAFDDCGSLTSVTIPDSVTSIG